MKAKFLILPAVLSALFSCKPAGKTTGKFSGKAGEVKLIQLDPEHGHAVATQSQHLNQLDTTVYVYAPDSSSISEYLQRIKSINASGENRLKWREDVYYGSDFLEQMVQEQKGNVVVLAGNNRKKIDYIEQAVNAGMNVFADKPMVIDKAGFDRLKNAYELAEKKKILMFDMMTERYNMMNKIQRSLMQDTILFGKLKQGSPDHPAILESSVHHFYRGGKGSRPAWYFDVKQQGEGIADVTTHLIDLTFWKAFPDQIIDYAKDIKVISATHSPVYFTNSEFSKATSLPEIPESLSPYLKDSLLEVFANGSIDYQAKGVYTRVKVDWQAVMPEGGNDLRSAYAEGTKATIFISQEYGQKQPALFIQKAENISDHEFQMHLTRVLGRLLLGYPGLSISVNDGQPAEIHIPEELLSGHDPTFQIFLSYLVSGELPKWEVPNTLAKYYITTTALEMASATK